MTRVSKAKVLVVEADADYRAVIARCVELAEGTAIELPGVNQGLRRLVEEAVDAVVWGISPGAARREDVVKALHESGAQPLIILDESYDDARRTFEAGADQVLPKPFVPGALVGAIKAALRGPAPASIVPLATRLELGDVVFDAERRTVRKGDRSEPLAGREWELLTYLLANPNQWYSAEELVRQAWRGSRNSPGQLRTYVARIRRKLSSLEPPFELASRQGRGYALVVPEEGGGLP